MPAELTEKMARASGLAGVINNNAWKKLLSAAPAFEPTNVSPGQVRYVYALEATLEQREVAEKSELAQSGDMVLVWANRIDLVGLPRTTNAHASDYEGIPNFTRDQNT